jgi:hypothetical protein
MIGMLQIITYLLCVYLVFKGVEILQIGLTSARENRSVGLAIGILAVTIAVATGAYFVKIIDAQATAVSSHTTGGGE